MDQKTKPPVQGELKQLGNAPFKKDFSATFSKLESLPVELAQQIVDDLPLSTILEGLQMIGSERVQSLIISHPFWGRVFDIAPKLHHSVFMHTVLQDMKNVFRGLPAGMDPYDRILHKANLRLWVLDHSAATWSNLNKPFALGTLVKAMRTGITVRLDYLRQVYGRSWLPQYDETAWPVGSEELSEDIARLHHSVMFYAHERQEIRELRERQVEDLTNLFKEYPYMFKKSADPHQRVRPNYWHKIRNAKSHAGILKPRNPRSTKRRVDGVRWLFIDPTATFTPHDFLILYFVQTLENYKPDPLKLPNDFADEFGTVKETIEGHVKSRGIDKPTSRKGNKEQIAQIAQWMDSFPVVLSKSAQDPTPTQTVFDYPSTILEDIVTTTYGLNHNYLLMSSYGRDWTAHHDPKQATIYNILRPASTKKRSKLFVEGVDRYEMELFPAEIYRHRHLIPRDTTELKWLNAFARCVMYMRNSVTRGSSVMAVD